MSGAAVNYLSKKVLNRQLGKVGKKEDPYFDRVQTTGCCGLRKKMKLVPKAAPFGATEAEAKVLKQVKKKAYKLDQSVVNIGGFRMGWSAVIGLVPEVGNAISVYLAYEVYKLACEVQPPLSDAEKARMILNIGTDAVVGIIPFVGDLADAFYKCNTRNAIILEHAIKHHINERRIAQGLPELYKKDGEEVPNFQALIRADPGMSQVDDPRTRLVPKHRNGERRDGDNRHYGTQQRGAPALPARH